MIFTDILKRIKIKKYMKKMSQKNFVFESKKLNSRSRWKKIWQPKFGHTFRTRASRKMFFLTVELVFT